MAFDRVPDRPRRATDGATALVLTLWVPNETSGGAVGARRWQWKGKCHAMARTSCHLDWSDRFFSKLTQRNRWKLKIEFVGAFGSPKRIHWRGNFPRNCLVQAERRKNLAHGGAVLVPIFGKDEMLSSHLRNISARPKCFFILYVLDLEPAFFFIKRKCFFSIGLCPLLITGTFSLEWSHRPEGGCWNALTQKETSKILARRLS